MNALKSKNEKLVAKFLKRDENYGKIVNEADAFEGETGQESKSLRRKQAEMYEKAAEAWDALPKYEQRHLQKTRDVSGY